LEAVGSRVQGLGFRVQEKGKRKEERGKRKEEERDGGKGREGKEDRPGFEIGGAVE
jgi:hypothetical protein